MKKTLAIILAMSLLCIMAVGTTLTYFTDKDSDVNTMTVGEVHIEQIEQKRDENGTLVNLVADTYGVTSLGKLYPYIGEAVLDDGWYDTGKNAVDKIVTVKNAGSEDAYVRTIFAFEMMFVDGAWVNPLDNSDGKAEVHLNVNGELTWSGVELEKDGAKYVVGVCIYPTALAAGTTTAPSLKQVALDSRVGNEFNTAVGNDGYNILVLSQAVQTQGFVAENGKTAAEVALDTAFGEITAANAVEIAGWFNN